MLHLGPIWYHSEPSDVRYSENLLRPISWFGLFLEQNDSNKISQGRKSVHGLAAATYLPLWKSALFNLICHKLKVSIINYSLSGILPQNLISISKPGQT